MKLVIDQSKEYKEVEITIKCGIVDKRLEKLISQIRLYSFSVLGKKDNKIFNIALENIYYFESVDEKSFIYTEDDVFETEFKLYELEKDLVDSRFVRISKSCILNIENLLSVKALLNGKYEATMNNDEKLIINRHYVPLFKEKFGL
ncbi:MAG: LytTR family transcriptional regulator [Oscillospiraceae bacterium]|nr:LytTR family transcriptional regulator [Oscillospiraceae bacterium]